LFIMCHSNGSIERRDAIFLLASRYQDNVPPLDIQLSCI
jgi:hypothetical protein